MKRTVLKAVFLLAFALVFLPLIAGCEKSPAESQCVHQLGPLQKAVAATFSRDGNVAYYRCAACDQLFDANQKEMDSVAIPKLSADLSICINGNASTLTLTQHNESLAVWRADGLSVASGDVITICSTLDTQVSYAYSGQENIDGDGSVIDSAENVTAALTASAEGLTLSLSGLKYPGIVIQINGIQYPMGSISCSEEENCAYTYGYVEFTAGDRFIVVDNVNDISYGFAYLSDASNCLPEDIQSGEDGQIVVNTVARYAVTFDLHGEKKIRLAKIFTPCDAEAFQVTFQHATQPSAAMECSLRPADFDLCDAFISHIGIESFENTGDIVDFISRKGLAVYSAVLFLNTDSNFFIEDLSGGSKITADHLTEVTGSIDRQELFIHVREAGTYLIRYLPAYHTVQVTQLSQGDLTETAKAFDKQILTLPSGQEQYYAREIKSLYAQYILLPEQLRASILTAEKLESMYRSVLEAESNPPQIAYYLSAANTGPVYPSKSELAEALFTDFYYYIVAYHGNKQLKKYKIADAEDLVAFSKDPDGAGDNNFSAIGDAVGWYFVRRDDNGIWGNQTDRSFAGFCYQNGMYQAQFPFFIQFFAHWRLDEGFATSATTAADFFSESWAPMVDTTKLFYYHEDNSYNRTDRIMDYLTRIAGVANWPESEDPLPIPTLRGYVFDGWYDNPEYSGDPLTHADLNSEYRKLYAKWSIDPEQKNKDAAALVDVYIYNLTTRGATRNATTVGYVKEMYDALTAEAQRLVTEIDTLQALIQQYLSEN